MVNHPELRKSDKKVAELAGDYGELRNCGSQILKVPNRNSATFLVRNSAIDLVVRYIAEVRTQIADAHLCYHTVRIPENHMVLIIFLVSRRK